jgi:hypothetical protein
MDGNQPNGIRNGLPRVPALVDGLRALLSAALGFSSHPLGGIHKNETSYS